MRKNFKEIACYKRLKISEIIGRFNICNFRDLYFIKHHLLQNSLNKNQPLSSTVTCSTKVIVKISKFIITFVVL